MAHYEGAVPIDKYEGKSLRSEFGEQVRLIESLIHSNTVIPPTGTVNRVVIIQWRDALFPTLLMFVCGVVLLGNSARIKPVPSSTLSRRTAHPSNHTTSTTLSQSPIV